MQHLDEGTIHAWLDGALDAEESARVEEHARECATCAAAVAEARGLVAGASRILTALDDVPAAVPPRSSALGGGSPAARSQSLWGRLHLTPLRAAAASLVFLAAGTLFVLRSAPNDKADLARVTLVADTARRPTLPTSVANNAPAIARNLADSTSVSAPEQRHGRPGSRVLRPGNRTEQFPPEAQAARGVVAEKSPLHRERATALADSMSVRPRDLVSDVVVTASPSQEQAKKAAAPAAAPVASSAVIGGTPQPAPMAARANFGYARPVAPSSFVGCYAVTADSAAALPAQLSLDSARAISLGGGVAGASDRVQRAPAPTIQDPARAVAAIVGDTRQPLANASWQPLANGAIRLSVDSPMRTLLLRPAPPAADLRGSTTVGGRVLPVTLKRVECR